MPWQPAGGSSASGVSPQYTSGALLYSTNYQVSPSVSVPAGTEGAPTDVLSITGFFDGTPVIMEFGVSQIQLGNVASNTCILNLWEDGVDTGRRVRLFAAAATGAVAGTGAYKRWAHTPPITNNTPTQHTYDIRGWGIGTSLLLCAPEGVGASTPIEFNIYRAVSA